MLELPPLLEYMRTERCSPNGEAEAEGVKHCRGGTLVDCTRSVHTEKWGEAGSAILRSDWSAQVRARDRTAARTSERVLALTGIQGLAMCCHVAQRRISSKKKR